MKNKFHFQIKFYTFHTYYFTILTKTIEIDNKMDNFLYDEDKNEFTFSNNFDCGVLKKILLNVTDDPCFYDEECTVSGDMLFQYFQQLKTSMETTDSLDLVYLITKLSDIYTKEISRSERMIEDDKIDFGNLERLFKIGEKIYGIHKGHFVGTIVHNTEIMKTQMGEILIIYGLTTCSNGGELYQSRISFQIPYYAGLRRIEDLEVQLLKDDSEMFHKLTERGRKYMKYCFKSNYLSYSGNMVRPSYMGDIKIPATGRIMIDIKGIRLIEPNYGTIDKRGQSINTTIMPDDLLFMMYPFLYGFSFNSKQWGQFNVDNIEDIKFREDAFDYLVLEEKRKHILKALITHSQSIFNDIVDDKSSGCIFLLEGSPGTGKTLTCEAVAELLHRPLYSVTVGELGTHADELEKRLSTILEMASSWKAIVLIDEADVFMEKRTTIDIERNTLVSIFLRLLERYDGIMFLTTNRCDTIDPAFNSRISITFKYPELDKQTRIKIWHNLLRACDITTLSENDINYLANISLNGREIKNMIRMGIALSKNDDTPLNMECIQTILNINQSHI